MEEERSDKGFTVKDRRIFSQDGEKRADFGKKEAGSREETKGREQQKEQRQQQVPLPEVNFSTFVFSLSSSALAHLGEIPDPMTGQKKVDLALAKQTIDILGMLEEKTKGNLTSEEDSLLKSVLYDLRLRFVKKKKAAEAK
ncbi:MAG TPA: DUF1844 domain-containing protein [Deltaproteobacteria bacterium]|nr:DUF1844 domain-containing protein [Deltaproteobacteria bacterium]HEC32258.1 DUF1844 domain-containing protein [Deltaproteobacteria bacterium]